MRKENLYIKQYGKVVEVDIYMYFNDIPEIKEQAKDHQTEKIFNYIGKDTDNDLDIYETLDGKKIFGVAGKHNPKWQFNEE